MSGIKIHFREFLYNFALKRNKLLGEGFTPLIPLPRIAGKYDLGNLYMKDEGIIPTGTFKARGAAVGVSKAKELGIRDVAMPTNGNAGAAWAAYAARAGISAHILMPEDAPLITRNESVAAGARVHLVRGLISDCGKILARSIRAGQSRPPRPGRGLR